MSSTNKSSRRIRGTIAPGETFAIFGVAETFYLVSCDGELSVKTDTGQSESYSGLQGKRAYDGEPFTRAEITNNTAAVVSYDIFYGFGLFIDNNVTVTATGEVNVNQIDRTFATPDTVSFVDYTADGTIHQLIPTQNTRSEVWLWSDTPATAWWGPDGASLSGTPPDTQKLTGAPFLGSFVVLKTKNPIYVKAAAGVKFRAIVFKN